MNVGQLVMYTDDNQAEIPVLMSSEAELVIQPLSIGYSDANVAYVLTICDFRYHDNQKSFGGGFQCKPE